MKRPFAQLNLGTTEASLEPNSGKVFLSQSKVKVSNVATEFNTVTGMGQEPVVYETTLLDVPQSTITVNNVPYQYISMDYLPIVGDDQALVTVAAEIRLTNDQVISHEFTNVPVRENYRTNIVGNLISSTTDFKVEIDDKFEEDYSKTDDIISNDYLVVDNVAAANDVLEAGETYVAINYIKNGETITLPDAAEYYLQIPAVDAKLNIVGDDATKVYITLVEDNSAVNGIELNIDTPSATVTVSKVGNPMVKKITSKTAPNTLILEGIVVDDIVVNGGNVILDNSTVEGGVTKGQDNQDTTTEVILSNGSEIIGGCEGGVNLVDISTIDNVKKLQDAVDKLSKVILDQDLTISDKITVTKDVVIDGNSKTITYVGSDRAFDVTSGANGANVTFKNLTIQLGSGYAERGINYNTNGYLTIENVKILDKPEVNAFTYAINLPGSSDDAKVEIRNSIIKGNIALNVWGKYVTVNAEETEFYSLDYTEVEGYSAVTLNNNGITSAENSVINIKGGKIIALDEKEEPSFATSNPTGTGKINIDPSTVVVGRVYTPVATVMYENQSQFYSCETLQAAIDKAIETNAKSVRLIADIELTEKVTIAKDANILLDLNGKTIVGVDEAETSFGLITNHAKLTIVGPGTISLSATNNRGWNAYSSVISNQPGGNLTVGEGVVIEHLGGTDMAYGIDNLTNSGIDNVKVVIDGATIKSEYIAIRQFLNCDKKENELLVKSRSVVNGKRSGIFFQDPSTKANKGTLTVENGSEVNGVYLSVTSGSTSWPVVVSIAKSALGNPGIETKNIPAGYDVKEVEGYYKVVSTGVAVVEGEVYQTLSSAINAVSECGVVTLVSDVKFDEGTRTQNGDNWFDGLYYIGDKSFTIDFNGYKITNDESVNDYLLNFKNNGTKANTITLKNGTVEAGSSAFCALCTSGASTQQITINLNNVTLVNNRSNGSTAKIRGGGILNLNSGSKIIGKNSYLGVECVASTLNIYKGAEIYMEGTSSYNGCLVGVCYGGTVNVYGGYGKGVKGGFIAMTSGGTINISGGEWIANTDGTIGDNSNLYVLTAQSNKYESGFVGPAIINVTGGTFRGGMDAWVLNNLPEEKAELNISGGNYNVNPQPYLVEGKTATKSNGIWNVK